MKTKRKGPLPIVILMNLILVALLALIIVFIVSFVKEFNADDPARPSSNVDSSFSSSADASSEISESSEPEESLQPDSSVEDSSVQTSSKPEYTSAVVPESSRVLNSYFDDAVFVGDSLTEGIKLYDIMSTPPCFLIQDSGWTTSIPRKLSHRRTEPPFQSWMPWKTPPPEKFTS